jgi:hypothetical protein
MQVLKSDLIDEAYSLMRISGITTVPGAEEIESALSRLEAMGIEWAERGYCVGYMATEIPDAGDPSGIPQKHKYVFSLALAKRLLLDFGKELSPLLQTELSQGVSWLAGDTVTTQETPYPARMPRGSGSTLRFSRWRRYFQPEDEAPLGCDTYNLYLDDVDSYEENYIAYLNDGEEVSGVVVEATDGLTVSDESLNSDGTIFSYTVSADTAGAQKLKFTATTDAGRITTRYRDFQITDGD